MTEPPATEPADTAEPAVPATEPAREPSGWSDMSEPAKTGSTKETKEEDLLARTRASQTWIAIIVFALVLILLLIFILQNTKKVEITYLGFTGTMPLAVAMLLSAVAGVLLTATAGTLRILQLRRRVRKSQRT